MPRKNGHRRLFQPRIPGVKREGSHASLLPVIREELEFIAERNGVTPSWVQSTLLAKMLGVEEQPDFKDARKLRDKAAKTNG